MMTDRLRPLAENLDDYARQLHSIAEIMRSIEDESAEQPTEAKSAEVRGRPLPPISEPIIDDARKEVRVIEWIRVPEKCETRGRALLMRETSSLIVALAILIALTSPLI